MAHRINKKEAESGGLVPPGRYYAEVEECEEKTSKGSGAPYYSLRLMDADSRTFLCFDVVMIGGKGAGIGVKKLKALGVVKEDGEEYVIPDASEVVGARCFITLAHETYDGKKRAKVDFNAGDSFGYEPEAGEPDDSATDLVPDPLDPFAAPVSKAKAKAKVAVKVEPPKESVPREAGDDDRPYDSEKPDDIAF